MQKNHYSVIGVMSGTSLDGVDLALIDFRVDDTKWTFEIIKSETICYSSFWVNQLQSAIHFSETELETLNQEYTQLLAQIIFDFIQKHSFSNLDAVCSHGHTILHQPQKGFTLQIGNLPELATIINQKVVCDFRIQDVQLGGQGAPLVPIGDRILFSDYDFCLNLGGFSNVSFEENGNRIAFDISPVNTVLNFYANQLGLEFDDKGKIARSGKVNQNLLKNLNSLDFYQKKQPKSLGFEFVKETILPLIDRYEIAVKDKLCTFTEHIAIQTALALDNILLRSVTKNMLVTGGGAYNDFLLERVDFYIPNIELIIPSKTILEYKEALIFGLLGVLKLRNEINVLSSVTGAKMDHSSGRIYK
ncbi:MAG: anhydro-N-acetylmuramic acid kinase [Flavobacterium sp.]|nr:anhydro-N-acetylmuramic acid kinase [Flavobacterium sp.]